GELTLIRKDGTCFPSEISSALFETRDGQINTSIIIHDISVRNQAQKELNQQIIELQEWHEVSVGREEKIIELKREVNILLTSSGKKMKYDIDE
ncbi:MAG: hypothetical protein WCI84_09990, partial [Bacteroidota bacterium]